VRAVWDSALVKDAMPDPIDARLRFIEALGPRCAYTLYLIAHVVRVRCKRPRRRERNAQEEEEEES
jgi:hypothetical protein